MGLDEHCWPILVHRFLATDWTAIWGSRRWQASRHRGLGWCQNGLLQCLHAVCLPTVDGQPDWTVPVWEWGGQSLINWWNPLGIRNPLRAYIQLSGKLLQSPSSPTLTVILTGTAAAPATATTPLATVQVEEHQELQEVPSMALRCLEPTMQRWDTATTMAGTGVPQRTLHPGGVLETVVERGVPGYFCWVVGHF